LELEKEKISEWNSEGANNNHYKPCCVSTYPFGVLGRLAFITSLFSIPYLRRNNLCFGVAEVDLNDLIPALVHAFHLISLYSSIKSANIHTTSKLSIQGLPRTFI
jgi:hypothetical protein